jgi:hypothetical protein
VLPSIVDDFFLFLGQIGSKISSGVGDKKKFLSMGQGMKGKGRKVGMGENQKSTGIEKSRVGGLLVFHPQYSTEH